MIFGPARRRLKAVQAATERLGAGDLDARAPEHGGDEVTALARSFNQMAGELAHRTRALETADAARRQLLADVSHELMTPLTAMRGYIETLSMSELQIDPPTRERYLQIVSEETHRLERIVGDLLDLARLEGGGTTLRQERVQVAALFDRVAARHERELRQRGIRLEFRVNAGAEDVIGDPDRLEQALQNLAANALRHTPDGGQITLTSEAVETAGLDESAVRLSVRDTGPGIPEEHLPLIFERFYKADAARKSGRRQRSGPVDRQSDRRAPRGNHHRAQRAGSGFRDRASETGVLAAGQLSPAAGRLNGPFCWPHFPGTTVACGALIRLSIRRSL